MTDKPITRAESLIAVAFCALASLLAIAWSWHNNAMMNYGDAVAHLHIARRIFDARLPRFSMLGSVWLPLPHILMIPFVQVYSWWANGIAGLIPSALAYLAACAGIYRLARHWLQPAAAAIALAFFALNPNLLYLQTTAMTEPLFIALMIWTVLLSVEWHKSLITDPRHASRKLCYIALVLIAAIYTRYDGWIMACIAWIAIFILLIRHRQLRSRTFWILSLLILAAPIAWFFYNATCFEDWLAFLRGPYSAKAIEARSSTFSGPPHPGWHNPWVSLLFFLKAVELDTAAAAWGNTLLASATLGTIVAWISARRRQFAWVLLLWLPVPFYTYSVSWGSVPIFLPDWWPHNWYNLRYGMELLPALAIGLGFLASPIIAAAREFKPTLRCYATAALIAVIVYNMVLMIRQIPHVYIEGTKNINARRSYDEEIPRALRALLAQHPDATILMDTSVYPEIVSFTGIPLRQTINESDLYIFENALARPAVKAQIVLAFDGDAIDRAVKANPECLKPIARYSATWQRSATLYTTFEACPKYSSDK